MYELKRYLELILKGNPKVIEPLWAEHFSFFDNIWKSFEKDRKIVLSQQTIEQYVGYARGKIHNWKKGKGTETKNLYHAMRLIKEAHRYKLSFS